MTPPNRFRFRFWDQDACKFTSDDTCATLGLCVLPSGNVGYLLNNKLMVSDIFQAQQSTGLLDRNQKEIFEGDICRYGPGIIPSTYEILWDKTRWLGKHGRELIDLLLLQKQSFDLASEYYCEVIGNIYEHPELLK